MSAPSSRHRCRALPALLTGSVAIVSALVLGHGQVSASELAPAPSASGPVTQRTAAADIRPEAKTPALQDPMDRLRERLAQKLGASKVAPAGNPNVLRVTSTASASSASPAAEHQTAPT